MSGARGGSGGGSGGKKRKQAERMGSQDMSRAGKRADGEKDEFGSLQRILIAGLSDPCNAFSLQACNGCLRGTSRRKLLSAPPRTSHMLELVFAWTSHMPELVFAWNITS